MPKQVPDIAYETPRRVASNPQASLLAAHINAKRIGRPPSHSPLNKTPFSDEKIISKRTNRADNAASYASAQNITKQKTSGPDVQITIQKQRPQVKLTSDMFKSTHSPHPRHNMKSIHSSTALDDQKEMTGRIVKRKQPRHKLGRATALHHRKVAQLRRVHADENSALVG